MMSELRKDYILDRWVIISEKRGKRPKQFKAVEIVKDDQLCFFCKGNEHLTPQEIGRIQEHDTWSMRWFPNKFPAVMPKKGNASLSGLWQHQSAFGYHEVIVETNDHQTQLWDLSTKDLAVLLQVYNARVMDLSKKKGVAYVLVFKNHGHNAGTSIVHSHSQIITLPQIPNLLQDELQAVRQKKSCPYCAIIKKEALSSRHMFSNKSFIAFCPYASRFNYEAWIFPKKHLKKLSELSKEGFYDFAEILGKVLAKIKLLNCSFNYYFHYSPGNHDLHFHLEIAPKISIWGGFESGSDVIINSVSPEQAATFYRAK